jgi:hypothetical protein
MSEANVKVTILVVVRPGNRDLEDCDWFEATDKDKDELLERINGQTTTKGD